MTVFSSADARIEVFTFKEGVLSRVGHELRLTAERFRLSVNGDTVELDIEATGLKVANAVKDGRDDPGALSAGDRAEIERALHQEVLESHRYGHIQFRGTLSGQEVVGSLTLHGQSHPLRVPLRLEGGRRTGRVRLDQRSFGITPYRALMGALRVGPEVEVRFSAPA